MSSSVSTTVSKIDMEGFLEAINRQTETRKETRKDAYAMYLASLEMFRRLDKEYPEDPGMSLYMNGMDDHGNIFGTYVDESICEGGVEGGCNGFIISPVLFKGSIGFQLTLLRDVIDEGTGKYINKIMHVEALGYTPEKTKIFSNFKELTEDGIDAVYGHFSGLWRMENDRMFSKLYHSR